MRCSCQNCGTYMVHAESLSLGCVCPECGARCRACLGTDTVVSREALRRLKDDPALAEQFLPRDEAGGEDEPWQGEHFAPFPRDDEWVD